MRQKARLNEHPFDQGILGVSDLYRRAASQHDYVKAIVQNPDYTIIIMQTEQQAVLSGELRYVQADSTFGVEAAGSAKKEVEAAAIQAAGKRAFERNLFNIVYVCSYFLSLVGHGQWGGRRWRLPVKDGEVLYPRGTSAGFGSAPGRSGLKDGRTAVSPRQLVTKRAGYVLNMTGFRTLSSCSCVFFLFSWATGRSCCP